MQAAGRMRQLEFGQTIIAVATPDVQNLMRDCLSLKPRQIITMEHVLCYVLFNSVNAIGNALKHWSSQGLRFLQFVNDSRSVRVEEKCDLDTLYAASDKPCTVSEMVLSKLDYFQTPQFDTCETSKAIVKLLKDRTERLGFDVISNFVMGFDECERELEQEREMENEKETELPERHPFTEKSWNFSRILTADSLASLHDVIKPLSVVKFLKTFLSDKAKSECPTIQWDDAKIYVTRNFSRPLVENPPYDDFLRPVRLILFFPESGESLLLSEREADKVWRYHLQRFFTKETGGPILCGINFLLSGTNSSSILSRMVCSPGDVSAVFHSALTLFNGQTSFCMEDQDALKTSLLTSHEAVSAASFFCNHRGFRFMFQGSDLERTCHRIHQRLHAIECGNSTLTTEQSQVTTPVVRSTRGSRKRKLSKTDMQQQGAKKKNTTSVRRITSASVSALKRVTRSAAAANKNATVKVETI
jgi:hypothetical protein